MQPSFFVPSMENGINIAFLYILGRLMKSLSVRLVVLHHGEKIAEGEPQAVLNDPKVVEAYLGE